MKKIAVFASGAGTNANEIIDHFHDPGSTHGHPEAEITLIVSNKSHAGVLRIAAERQIPTLIIEREKFFHGNGYADELKDKGIDLIVLAGFLWKIPDSLIDAFPRRIINIHPALLPKYGGRGMYGQHVHQAVLDNKEKESGITIHYVDGHYDNGDIIFQARCPVLENDTVDSLAKRVQVLEHDYYPKVVGKLVAS